MRHSLRLLFFLLAVLTLGASCKPNAPPFVMRLPPRDAACAVDSDCAWDNTILKDGKCCGVCEAAPASKRHLKAVRDACQVLGQGEECPDETKKCAPPRPLKCVSGRCVAASP